MEARGWYLRPDCSHVSELVPSVLNTEGAAGRCPTVKYEAARHGRFGPSLFLGRGRHGRHAVSVVVVVAVGFAALLFPTTLPESLYTNSNAPTVGDNHSPPPGLMGSNTHWSAILRALRSYGIGPHTRRVFGNSRLPIIRRAEWRHACARPERRQSEHGSL